MSGLSINEWWDDIPVMIRLNWDRSHADQVVWVVSNSHGEDGSKGPAKPTGAIQEKR